MLNLDTILGLPASERSFEYSARDVVLYALSTGLGGPQSEQQFVIDEQLVCPPTFALIPGHYLPWLRHPDCGIDVGKMLHGETGLKLHAPIPPAGTLRIRQSVTGAVDRGPGRSVTVYFEQWVLAADSGDLLASVDGCFVFPGSGVRARVVGLPRVATELPLRAPDAVAIQRLSGSAAHLYRLTGDRNLLHVDRDTAMKAGFDAPILHGLCTFGHVGSATLRTLCQGRPDMLREIRGRYTAPTYPGDELRTEFHRLSPTDYGFRCIASNRAKTVIDSGHIVLEELP